MSTLCNVFQQSDIDAAAPGTVLRNNPKGGTGDDYTLLCTVCEDPAAPGHPILWRNNFTGEKHQVGIVHPRGTIVRYGKIHCNGIDFLYQLDTSNNFICYEGLGCSLLLLEGCDPSLATPKSVVFKSLDDTLRLPEWNISSVSTYPTNAAVPFLNVQYFADNPRIRTSPSTYVGEALIYGVFKNGLASYTLSLNNTASSTSILSFRLPFRLSGVGVAHKYAPYLVVKGFNNGTFTFANNFASLMNTSCTFTDAYNCEVFYYAPPTSSGDVFNAGRKYSIELSAGLWLNLTWVFPPDSLNTL